MSEEINRNETTRYQLRWPNWLKDELSLAAKRANRPINGEILYRLRLSFGLNEEGYPIPPAWRDKEIQRFLAGVTESLERERGQ